MLTQTWFSILFPSEKTRTDGFIIHLIRFILIRKVLTFYIIHVLGNSVAHFIIKIEISPQKSWMELVGHSQHIVNYQNLAIYMSACADTNYGYGNAFRDLFGQFGWNFLQN